VRREFWFRIWLLKKKIHYVVAFFAVAIVFFVRYSLQNALGDSIQLLWFSLPIALASFMGGLGPGIFATTLSVIIGSAAFVLPSARFASNQTQGVIQIVSFSIIWVFIAIVCDVMRNAAISYRKVATERDEGRRQISTILNGVSDGFCAVNRKYEILLTNRAFRAVFGSYSGAADGTILWDVLSSPNEESMKEQLDVALATGKPVMFDQQITNDGRWFHVRGFPDSEGLFIYVQDITARRQVEMNRDQLLEEEKKARTDAEQTSRLKDEFVATVSHELRTPLTTILGWSEVLASRPNVSQDPELVDGLRAIERSTRLQAQLIDDLLDMSRIANGKLQLNVEVVDLLEVLDQAVQSCAIAAESRGVKVHKVYGEEDVLVRGDHSRLIQVFGNLLSNAVKFSSKNGQVWVKVALRENSVTVTVKDEGVGIDPANLDLIFDRFRQANNTITRRHGGLGLGLAIVRQLTELHGGSVGVTSDGLGTGAQFSVTLPVAPFPNAGQVPAVKAPTTAVRIDGLRVLVVEDDDSTRKLLTVVLKEAGAHVNLARSALEGLDELERNDIDIIVSDIGLPEMDGFTFMETVRRSDHSMPAVALTAFTREEDKERAAKSGFSAHLAKPVDINRLLSTIKTIAGDGQAESR